MKFLVILICLCVTGCIETYPSMGTETFKYGDDLVIRTITDDFGLIQEKCDQDALVNGCWIYHEEVKTHIVWTIPVKCVIDHEMRHVREGQWHTIGHMDECSRTHANWWITNNVEEL